MISIDEANKIWTQIYFADLGNFDEVNKVFNEFFTSKPARTSVQVAKLPLDLSLEMDVTALA